MNYVYVIKISRYNLFEYSSKLGHAHASYVHTFKWVIYQIKESEQSKSKHWLKGVRWQKIWFTGHEGEKWKFNLHHKTFDKQTKNVREKKESFEKCI